MVGHRLAEGLPEDKEVAVGVLDIRTSMIETPQQVADRIRKVIEIVPPERVYLTTDCGMKPLARTVAKMKLRALVEGAQIVRDESWQARPKKECECAAVNLTPPQAPVYLELTLPKRHRLRSKGAQS